MVEVGVVTFKKREPDPDCERCHGAGTWLDDNGNPTDLLCPCSLAIDKQYTEERDITVEETADGGAIIHGL